jgi:hypothetical protein
MMLLRHKHQRHMRNWTFDRHVPWVNNHQGEVKDMHQVIFVVREVM